MRRKIERVRLVAYLPRELYDSVCAEAAETGQSISGFVINALRHGSWQESVRKIVREELGK